MHINGCVGGPQRRHAAQLPAGHRCHQPDPRRRVCGVLQGAAPGALSCTVAIQHITRHPLVSFHTTVAECSALLTGQLSGGWFRTTSTHSVAAAQNTVRGGLLAPKFAAVQQERVEAAGMSAMDLS